jgi:low affinity Fe/Cu permease
MLMKISNAFAKASHLVARRSGHPVIFALCCTVIVVWAATGPLFDYSNTWQLVISTGTSVATFLMVFLIQNTQNRDSAAIQAKLDELIRASTAENAFIGIDYLTHQEVDELRAKCAERAKEKGKVITGASKKMPKAAKSTG